MDNNFLHKKFISRFITLPVRRGRRRFGSQKGMQGAFRGLRGIFWDGVDPVSEGMAWGVEGRGRGGFVTVWQFGGWLGVVPRVTGGDEARAYGMGRGSPSDDWGGGLVGWVAGLCEAEGGWGLAAPD